MRTEIEASFDSEGFFEEIRAYQSRHLVSDTDLCLAAEIDRRMLNKPLSLLTAASLSLGCDVSLDKFVRKAELCEICTGYVNYQLVKVYHPVGRECGHV